MQLEAEMHRQSRDALAVLRANRGECPGRVAFVDFDTARRHALRGVSTFLCPTCYRFHHGSKPAKPLAIAERLFG